MMRLLVASALAAVALAACPNQCSGHGWCDENERCVCFRAPGTANQNVAYLGADCSQRVCPYGRSHDIISDSTASLLPQSVSAANKYVGFVSATGSSSPHLQAYLNGGFLLPKNLGIDLRVVSVSSQSLKFQWKTNLQKIYYPEVTAVVDGDSTPLYTTRTSAFHVRPDGVNSGLYIYFDVTASTIGHVMTSDSYFLNVSANNGMILSSADANTAHQFLECSGRGTCDRVGGSCHCVAGYTGDACQRTSCPNDCSGNGICQNEAYFVNDVATSSNDVAFSYSGFDATSAYGCKCDAGFRGADCSQRECPSGSDPMKGNGGPAGMDCSGRGLCDYTKGVCKCFKGFFGERCEELSTLV